MKVGNKAILRKIEKILPEMEKHPATGIDKPEALKGEFAGVLSAACFTGFCAFSLTIFVSFH